MMWILVILLRYFRWFIDVTSDIIYQWLYEDQKQLLPPFKNDITLMPATELATKIRNRQLKCIDVIEAYIQRIQAVNPIVNCLVDTRFNEARIEAQSVDDLLDNPQTSREEIALSQPFLGVPFTTKDCFAVKGLSWTVGLLERKGQTASLDADTVQNMKEAGAIAMGVSNVSELCMWYESANNVYGRSNNPYHTGRMVGGSSGGEACAISSGCSIFGIGSDVGGSIRMPAFFNGIFGHKPSTGIVSNYGQLPQAQGVINTFLSTGPLCRYAQDLMPMFKVLAGPKQSLELELDKPVDIRKLKIFYMVDDGGHPLITPVDSEMRKAQMNLVHKLEQDHGLQSHEVKLKGLYHSAQIWSNKMSSEPTALSFAQELKQGNGAINPYWEFLKWMCFKNSDHTLPALGLAMLDPFVGPHQRDHKLFLERYESLKAELEALLGDDGILLYPSHPTSAPYHGQAILRTFNFGYTAIFNVLGNPVTQCPLGLSSKGLPLGTQIVGPINKDRNTLALAQLIEKSFGGWVNPC